MIGGDDNVVVAMGRKAGHTPIPFADVLDARGDGRRRAVDVTTESYQVARAYMVRLGPADFRDASWTAALARAAGFDDEAFRARFEPSARRHAAPPPA